MFNRMERSLRIKMYAIIILFMLLPVIQFEINNRREKIIPTKNVFVSLTPGEFAGTLMLGGFRGLAVNVLWIRAEQLKRENRVFELVAISDMITKLQPHDRMVWEYNAWNRAYNISVDFMDPEEKWKWVKSGIELNMEAIRRMPDNWKLKNHLGFMFFHKCGEPGFPELTLRDFGEDNYTLARRYYKKALIDNPNAPLYIDRLIIHTYERQGNFETARQLYKEHLKKHPKDTTARRNLEKFIVSKELFSANQEKALKEFRSGNFRNVVEIYEDNLKNDPYLMPADVIEAVLMSYYNTRDVEKGIDFIHRKMNLKMEDSESTYALYEKFTKLYNDSFLPRFRELRKKGDTGAILALFEEKITKKNVEISIEIGIIVLDSMLKAGKIDDARHLLADLERQFPEDPRIVPFKGTLHNNKQ